MESWKELKFWNSGEYQVIQEHWNDLKKRGVLVNPSRRNIFRSLRATPLAQTKVILMGQDPYPDPELATGLAFSIPADKAIPESLKNIFKEYTDDLHYPYPANGDLSLWAERGVLLWNVIPSCTAWKSLSHNWVEWDLLNKEILLALQEKGDVVFVALGQVAREKLKHINSDNKIIETSHPSPLGARAKRNPFLGSRVFSRINGLLKDPIDWKL